MSARDLTIDPRFDALVPADAALEGLAELRPGVEELLERSRQQREQWPETLPHREHLLSVNENFAEGILRLTLEWLNEAEKTLRAQK
jgi:hypothetical protein